MKYVVMVVFVAIMATFPAHACKNPNADFKAENSVEMDEDECPDPEPDIIAPGANEKHKQEETEDNNKDDQHKKEPDPDPKPIIKDDSSDGSHDGCDMHPDGTCKGLISINEIVPSKTTGHTERKAKSIIKDIKKNTLISIDIHIPIYFNTEKEIIVTGRTTVNNHNETFTLTLIKRF